MFFTSLFISPIVAALFVPAVILFVKGIKAGGKKRFVAIYTVVTITATIVCIILAGGIKIYYDYNHVIGTYNGHEPDEIIIDGVTYFEDYANDYSASDQGHYLGSVVFAGQTDYKTDPKFVWEIKDSEEFIYVTFGYDGTIYRKAD